MDRYRKVWKDLYAVGYDGNFVLQRGPQAMAYNKRNRLQRIIEIQEITLRHKKRGVTQLHVYEKYIRPRFLISLRTYNNYLGINAKSLIKQQPVPDTRQLSLF